jgi:hypothetical protein
MASLDRPILEGKHQSGLLDEALRQSQLGLSVIPAVGKKPAVAKWEGFQTNPADEKAIRRLFARPGITGLAVILGSASLGLRCRDFDSASSYFKWASEHPDLARTLPTDQSGRGNHVFFRGGPEAYVQLDDGEYRGDAKHYVILPPSLHESGVTYRWLIPLRAEVPSIDPVAAGLLLLRPGSLAEAQSAQSAQSVWHFSPCEVGIEDAVERAILATLPTPDCKRHRSIFNFARRLKAIPELSRQPATFLRPHFQEWWLRALPFVEDKSWDEAWRCFSSGWVRVRKPAFSGPGWSPGAAMAMAMEEPLPAAAMAYCRQEVRLLVALCRKLQQLVGDNSFFLSCRGAAEQCCPGGDVERDAKTMHRWMEQLVSDGVLLSVCKGRATPKSGVASEWRYIGD